MNNRAVEIFLLFIGLLLVQVVVCNHIILFGVAIPFIFIYFILHMPVSMNTILLLTLSFALGLGVDICSDTAGMNALACTVIAMMKRKVFFSYVQKDDHSEGLVPGIASMGLGSYTRYVVTLTTIYCLILFSLEYFSFADVKEIIIKTLASSALTSVLLLAVDSLTIARREKRL